MPRSPISRGLNAVAAAANVSAMTVSRALRNSPHVAAATRTAVLRAAKKVGYVPNPQVARLMGIVRRGKQQRLRAIIGVVRDNRPDDELQSPAYQFVTTSDIRARAEQHGFGVEEFLLEPEGITPARLGGILQARGIDGIIVSPQSSRAIGSQLDFTAFAAATLGYGLRSPALHRASTNMTQGILQASAELSRRGYVRIGLAVPQFIDVRADHTYSGALLHFQQNVPAKHRVPPLFLPDNPAEGADRFVAWMRKYESDVLITLDTLVPEWLTKRLKLRIPEDIGLVVHDWTPRMSGFAGIDHRRAHVAAAAVDLVATQLMHNEHGVPEVPRQILIPSAWIDGPSIRSAATS